MQFLAKPVVQKFLLLSLYGILGAAAQSGLLPPSLVDFLQTHAGPAILLAFGLGHVLPEAAKK